MTLLVLAGCAAPTAADAPGARRRRPRRPRFARPSAGLSATPASKEPIAPTPTPTPTEPPVLASDGRPREARLSIPALGLERLRVKAYRGTPDDARGTKIQDGGIAANPYGAGGTVGVGGIGNYVITGHRTSSTRPFARLPRLEKGAKVHLVAGGRRYTYEITTTRITSFRSKRSLRPSSPPPVPGRIGRRARPGR